MADAADTALQFCRGRSRADLDSDVMLRFALTRAVEVIGEAAARVSEAGRAASTDVPWPAIVGMRNRLVHAYFDVDKDILWTTVADRLPTLLQQLNSILERK